MSQDDATPTSDDTAAPTETAAADTAPTAAGAHPVLVYTLLRLLILGLTTGVLYLLGLRQPLILLVFAFLISGVISIFALNRRREVAAVEVVTAVQKVNQRIDSSAASEDAAVDAAQVDQSATSGAFPGANGTGTGENGTGTGENGTGTGQNGTGTGDAAEPAASTGRPARSRDIPADDDLDDLEPTDRP